MCWQYGREGVFTLAQQRHDYTLVGLERLCEIIDEVRSFRPRIMLWGGEPFLYPHLLAFIQYIKDNSLRLQIITNGTLLERYASALVRLRVDRVVVSIDGPEEIHDLIRGVPHTFQRIKRGLEELERSKRATRTRYPELVANFTITPLNYTHLRETIELLEGLPIQALIVSHMWYTTEELATRHRSLFLELFHSEVHSWKGLLQDVSGIDLERLAQQLEVVTGLQWRLPITFIPFLRTRDELWAYYREPENTLQHHRCLVPWRTTAILPDGSLTPCSDRPDYIVGNIREKGLKELWGNPRYHLFRQVLREKGLFPLCYRCCELFLH